MASAEVAQGAHGRRVVRVFSSSGDAPEQWAGTFGNAAVEAGEDGYQFSDGEVVRL